MYPINLNHNFSTFIPKNGESWLRQYTWENPRISIADFVFAEFSKYILIYKERRRQNPWVNMPNEVYWFMHTINTINDNAWEIVYISKTTQLTPVDLRTSIENSYNQN